MPSHAAGALAPSIRLACAADRAIHRSRDAERLASRAWSEIRLPEPGARARAYGVARRRPARNPRGARGGRCLRPSLVAVAPGTAMAARGRARVSAEAGATARQVRGAARLLRPCRLAHPGSRPGAPRGPGPVARGVDGRRRRGRPGTTMSRAGTAAVLLAQSPACSATCAADAPMCGNEHADEFALAA